MSKVRHVLGISGGKDSAALAIYLHKNYPELDLEYYFCDTDKELEETYSLISKLESYLGKEVVKLQGVENSHEDSFDHFYKLYGGFLPSTSARWCTKKLKLEPFERYVGNDPVVSYVGIRGDENREGYISKKSNIQSIFPFRKNIWSKDVVNKILNNNFIQQFESCYRSFGEKEKMDRAIEIIRDPISNLFSQQQKLTLLLDLGVKEFNMTVYELLNGSEYPLANSKYFPLISNEEVLVRDDIFRILEESGVGVPEYYEKVEFEVNGKKGEYARSRSGCFFCFFQQKIEWVWLYEKHPEKFKKAMEYEKDGYSWMGDETLEELIRSERIEEIKEEAIRQMQRKSRNNSPYLLDRIDDAEGDGCNACFI
jgi:3'-phosphoadenosine 5'-phosphosulfate sulfotransferase (PAPS reductase)/FAD synthetase